MDSSGTCGNIYKHKEWRAMDIEEALYRVANELELVAMESRDNVCGEFRSQDVEQLPIAWELIRYTVYKKSIENSHFKTGKDSFVNEEDTVRGES